MMCYLIGEDYDCKVRTSPGQPESWDDGTDLSLTPLGDRGEISCGRGLEREERTRSNHEKKDQVVIPGRLGFIWAIAFPFGLGVHRMKWPSSGIRLALATQLALLQWRLV